MRANIAAAMLPIILDAICLGQSVTPVPSIKQWNTRGQPLSIEPVPPLVPVWSVDIQAAKHAATPTSFTFTMGAGLTDKIVVVLSCLNTAEHAACGMAQLLSFDAKTGKFLNSLEWSRSPSPPGPRSDLGLFSNSMETFLVEDNGALTEYNDAFKSTNHVKLPRGFVPSLSRAYGYWDWAETTKTTCKGDGVSVYELNENRKLIIGCGNEVGVLNENWQLLFAELYVAPINVGSPVFSLDGNRFILMATRDHAEPPSHQVMSYMLYDVHPSAQNPRQIVFSVNAGTPANLPVWISLSPNGTMFAVIEQGTLSIYRLPQ
jgi:hypothetical protein